MILPKQVSFVELEAELNNGSSSPSITFPHCSLEISLNLQSKLTELIQNILAIVIMNFIF